MTKAVIFGATGAIGTALSKYLVSNNSDWTIDAVTRDATSDSRLKSLNLANVTMVTGDPFDEASVLSVSQDADVLFCCIGFHKYEAKYWSKHWPVVVENLLKATITTSNKKKKLIFCDNLYAYGNPAPQEINPKTTARVEASLSKGKPNVRSWMHARFQQHMKDHPGTLAIVGGADFFGPHVTQTSFLGDTCAGKIVPAADSGKSATALCVGSADQIHDFCYSKDFAKAMAIAAVEDSKLAMDHFWICPHAIHNKTMRQIAADIAVAAKAPAPPKMQVLGKWMVYLLSPFMGFMSEMKEMLPLWVKDYQVDDSDFCKTFGMEATPYEQALNEYVQFYQQQSKLQEKK